MSVKRTILFLFYKTPIYDYILSKDLSAELISNISDPWEGKRDNGYNILNGYLSFFGETIKYNKSIWERNSSTNLWKEEVSSFNWIKDLKTIGSNKARIFLRNSIKEWISKNNKWNSKEWRSDLIGKRICALLSNFNFYCSSADDKFQKLVLENILKQGKHLLKNKLIDINGYKKIFAIKGMIAISVVFKQLRANLEKSLCTLLNEVNEQVLDDGCHYLKSPKQHSEFLQNLIDIKSFLAEAKLEIPQEINECISKMGLVLRFFKSTSGQLTTFNDSIHINENLIKQVILRSNSNKRIPNFLKKSGFQRISKNRINLIMDCGSPSLENTYAGSLSFEFSVGKNQIVVNCGSPFVNNKQWTEAMKSTAAHSTISIDNVNSTDIILKKRIAKVWSQRKEQPNNFWIDSAHSGYKDIFGLVHSRKIHIDSNKHILRGQDYFSQATKNYERIAKRYSLRFHLFPNIEVNVTGSKKKAILKLPDGTGWEFICSEPNIQIKESIYLKKKKKIINNHLLINNPIIPEKKIRWLFRLIK